jgi:hypothetical protein
VVISHVDSGILALLKFYIAGIMRKGVADTSYCKAVVQDLPRHYNQPHLTTYKQEKY